MASDAPANKRFGAAGCAAAKKAYARSEDDDDFGPRWPRRIELGSGTRAISLSTHNGPVAVKEAD